MEPVIVPANPIIAANNAWGPIPQASFNKFIAPLNKLAPRIKYNDPHLMVWVTLLYPVVLHSQSK